MGGMDEGAEIFSTKVDAGDEQLLFVWKGSVQVKDANGLYSAGEKDTVFLTGPAEVTVTAATGQGTSVIHVQAPQQQDVQ
jgi:hypothetical protein